MAANTIPDTADAKRTSPPAHSPLPWTSHRSPDGRTGTMIRDGGEPFPGAAVGAAVCKISSTRGHSAGEANAALIVRAVNAHNDLIAALKRAREFCDMCDTRPLRTLEMIDAALAKAEGAQP